MVGPYDAYINSASQRFGVDPNLVRSVMRVESSGKPNAVSHRGAGGLLQLMPDTFEELRVKHGLGSDRFDPETNINAGTAYLAQMNQQFGGDIDDTLAAFNAGPGRLGRVKAGQARLPAETQQYIKKVKGGMDMGLLGQTTGRGPSGGLLSDEEQILATMAQNQMPPQPGGFSPQQAQMVGGVVGGFGQRPAPAPAAMPQPNPVNSRIQELIGQTLDAPQPQRQSSQSLKLQGALESVNPLAGITNRRVSMGEVLGAAGAGVGRGEQAALAADRQHRADQFGELNNMVQVGKYQDQQVTNQRQLAAANAYADQLEKAGHADLAAAVRNNPSLADEVLKAQASSQFPKEGGGFSLSPGQSRYDANGNVIVEGTPNGVRTLSRPEIEQLGLPQGTVAQQDHEGKVQIVSKPEDKGFDNTTKLRSEYVTQAKPLADSRQMYGRMAAAYEDDSGVGDIALVYSYMKMLDPTSVVREGEFATAETAGGVPDRVMNLYNKVVSGERLSKEVRTGMFNQGSAQHAVIAQQHDALTQTYRDLALRNGLKAEDVILDLSGGVKAAPVGKLPVGTVATNPAGGEMRWNGQKWEQIK